MPSSPPELVPHETVVKELVEDTVSYGAELGAGGMRFSAGSFPQAIFIAVKVINTRNSSCKKFSLNVAALFMYHKYMCKIYIIHIYIYVLYIFVDQIFSNKSS